MALTQSRTIEAAQPLCLIRGWVAVSFAPVVNLTKGKDHHRLSALSEFCAQLYNNLYLRVKTIRCWVFLPMVVGKFPGLSFFRQYKVFI